MSVSVANKILTSAKLRCIVLIEITYLLNLSRVGMQSRLPIDEWRKLMSMGSRELVVKPTLKVGFRFF